MDFFTKSFFHFLSFFKVNECLADVWELQEYKLMVHQSKMEALREALKAADEQLSQQKSRNTQLELEVLKQI